MMVGVPRDKHIIGYWGSLRDTPQNQQIPAGRIESPDYVIETGTKFSTQSQAELCIHDFKCTNRYLCAYCRTRFVRTALIALGRNSSRGNEWVSRPSEIGLN